MRNATWVGMERAALLALLACAAGGCLDSLPFGLRDAVDGVSEGQSGDGAGGSAGIYYVSVEGDDQADGLTTATAFRTVSRAARAVPTGGTIAVLPGTYRETTTLEDIGGPDGPITIRGEGGVPVFDGDGTMGVGFWCTQCRNVTFENLEFRDYTDVGVLVMLSSDVVLRRLDVHDNGFAARLDWVEGYGIHAEDSTGVVIEENEVYRNGPSPQRPDRLLGTGIDTFNLTDSTIRNNRSHDNVGGGILVEDSVNVLVEGNEVTANELDGSAEEWWDGGLWVDGGHDIVVRNNLFSNNNGPGIEISDEDNQQPFGYVLDNNTSTGNLYGIYIWNFGTSDFPPEEVLSMSGNTISQNTVLDVWIVPWECPPYDPCE